MPLSARPRVGATGPPQARGEAAEVRGSNGARVMMTITAIISADRRPRGPDQKSRHDIVVSAARARARAALADARPVQRATQLACLFRYAPTFVLFYGQQQTDRYPFRKMDRSIGRKWAWPQWLRPRHCVAPPRRTESSGAARWSRSRSDDCGLQAAVLDFERSAAVVTGVESTLLRSVCLSLIAVQRAPMSERAVGCSPSCSSARHRRSAQHSTAQATQTAAHTIGALCVAAAPRRVARRAAPAGAAENRGAE